MYCKDCGTEIPEDAVVCTSCGAQIKPLVATYTNPIAEDIPSTGLNILSLFFPIVGLILYLVYMDKTPKRAKKIGKFAIIGASIGVAISVLFAIIFPIMAMMFFRFS